MSTTIELPETITGDGSTGPLKAPSGAGTVSIVIDVAAFAGPPGSASFNVRRSVPGTAEPVTEWDPEHVPVLMITRSASSATIEMPLSGSGGRSDWYSLNWHVRGGATVTAAAAEG